MSGTTNGGRAPGGMRNMLARVIAPGTSWNLAVTLAVSRQDQVNKQQLLRRGYVSQCGPRGDGRVCRDGSNGQWRRLDSAHLLTPTARQLTARSLLTQIRRDYCTLQPIIVRN